MTRQLPFRTRLTLANTAIVALAVVLLGAVAFVTVRITLVTSLETRLETTAKAIRSVVDVDVKEGGLKQLDPEDHQQLLAVLGQRVDGAVLRNDGSLLASNLAAPPAAMLRAIENRATPSGTVLVAGTPLSYVATPIAEHGVRYGTAAAWEPRTTTDDAVRVTLIALSAAGLAVIVAAAAAGGTLTRRMLRPVTELSAMISDIEASDLTERLIWDGPDDELGRLCATFDRLLDRLETAFARERQFIADASHELRTPLSVMRAEVELALMHERDSETYRSAFVRLQRETQRLETLAQSLLLTARNDALALALTPVAAARVAEDATMRMQPLAVTRGITLTCDAAASVDVMSDAPMLEAAIVALIDNALRYAQTRVAVRIAATSGETAATIAVSDDGPGFSKAGLREATARFWRDDPSRSGTGTGLGLAIVRSTIERHQGTIELRNGPDGGAVVVLTLAALGAKSGVIGNTEGSPA